MTWSRRPAGAGPKGSTIPIARSSEQFSRLGIREIELDVFADPKGGLYAEPNLRKMVKNRGKDPGPDPAADGKLSKPGFKVLHVQDVDFRTHAPTFVDALKQIRSWSRANRRHVPIMIMVELKDEAIFGLSTKPAKFGRDEVDEVDAEILSVFDRSEILTPDRVRGRFETLPEAIQVQGWPALDAVRGLVMFSLENENALREQYLDGHQALQGRVMFTTVAPTRPRGRLVQYQRPDQGFRPHPEARPRRLPRPHSRRCRHRTGPGQRHHPAREGTGQRSAVHQHRLP